MKKNIIIAVETIIIVILIVILLSNSNSTGTKETPKEDPNKALIGIYYNEQDRQTIRLEENNICMFVDENRECSYSVENDIIKIHTTFYTIEASNPSIVKLYKSMKECEEDLKTNHAYSNLQNAKCVETELAKQDSEARIINNGNGLFVSNKIFNKIA